MARSLGYKNIELRQLRSFCLAATQENFTTAAEALGLSVPTVWEQVRALERKLRARLLSRRGRTVALTAEGRLLLELIQPHVSSLDSVERVFESRRTEVPQQLTVASTDYLFAYHLMRPIRAFNETHHEVRLHLHVGLWSGDVAVPVERGLADIGVMTYHPAEPRHTGLEYEDLVHLPLLLLTAARHPLARKQRLGLADVVACPLITAPPETLTQRTLERLLHRHGLTDQLHSVMVAPSVDLTLKYVAGGIGVALRHMSLDAARAQPGLHVRAFGAEPDAVPAAVVVRCGAYLPAFVEEFRTTLRRHCGSGS